MYETSFSNYQTIYSGQCGTTNGGIVSPRRFKSKKEAYEYAIKEDQKKYQTFTTISKKKNTSEERKNKTMPEKERDKIYNTLERYLGEKISRA